MTPISGTNIQVCQLTNQQIPQEGPKSIPLTLDFSTESSYFYDGTIQQNLAYISMVQTLWVNTSNMAGPLQIDIPGAQFSARIPANMQGYLQVLCPNPFRIQFTSVAGAGAGNTGKVQMINVPIATALFSTI